MFPKSGRLPCVGLLVAILICAPTLRAAPGLYGDDAAKVTSGDIDDQDYWWTKFDMMMLDLAMQQRQPEGAISLALASTINRLDELVKKYPNDDELKAWQKKAKDIDAKIDPNARNKGTSFNPGCPWDEANFAQIWVNLNHASMKVEAKEDNDALGLLQNVERNLEIMLRPDRMKDYPEELRKWVQDAKPKADAMVAKLKDRVHK